MHYLNYEEHRRHGTDDFPLEYYLVDEQHPRYNMPHHWHRETELLYVRKGEFHLSLNGKSYCIRSGELCYIAAGMLHGGEPADCAYECIDFTLDTLVKHTGLVRDYLRKTEGKNAGIQVLFTKEQPGILKCASRMFAAARTREDGWELLVLAGLFDFYGTVIQQRYYNEDETVNHAYNQMQSIKAALEYIAMNYQNPLTLEELARITGQSPKYFCRCFRMAVHRTPIDYLNYYRIERACYLLEQKARSVTQIAYECGFNDCSYFIRCFKKYKGITPNQYARNVTKHGVQAITDA